MHTQEIACPNCNERMWANVPDPPGQYGLSGILGFRDTSTRCPHCRRLINVSVGSDGGIRSISVVSEGCLLTTACCTAKGLPDDCYQLRSTRALRDTWLIHQPSGDKIIYLYYQIAPRILSALRNKLTIETYKELMNHVFSEYIQPSVDAWERKKAEKAFGILCDMIEYMVLAADIEVQNLSAYRLQVTTSREIVS
jgi:hypothetical protein